MSFVGRMHTFVEEKSFFSNIFRSSISSQTSSKSVVCLEMICSSRHIKNVIYIIWTPINRFTAKKGMCSKYSINQHYLLHIWPLETLKRLHIFLLWNDGGFEKVVVNVVIFWATKLVIKTFFNIFVDYLINARTSIE